MWAFAVLRTGSTRQWVEVTLFTSTSVAIQGEDSAGRAGPDLAYCAMVSLFFRVEGSQQDLCLASPDPLGQGIFGAASLQAHVNTEPERLRSCGLQRSPSCCCSASQRKVLRHPAPIRIRHRRKVRRPACGLHCIDISGHPHSRQGPELLPLLCCVGYFAVGRGSAPDWMPRRTSCEPRS